MVGTDACNCVARVCSATLTMVVSKMTARNPMTRIRALLSTSGSILSWSGAGVAAMMTFSK
jgi:hypothetical protein